MPGNWQKPNWTKCLTLTNLFRIPVASPVFSAGDLFTTFRKKKMKRILAAFFAAAFLLTAFAPKQKIPSATPVIFAVLEDGKMIEPIVRVENGSLTDAYNSDSSMRAFRETYYAPKTSYTLVYNGRPAGKVTVVKNDPAWECTANMAEVTTSSPIARLKGHTMALATNMPFKEMLSPDRRVPTAAEKAGVEKLVIAEFRKQNIVVKNLKMVSGFVMDPDKNKSPEVIGTWIVSPSPKERALIFLVAERSGAKWVPVLSNVQTIREEEVMSGEISAVDEGIYNELLIDMMDTDNDGVAELFTTSLSFEGVGYNVYRQKADGRWERLLENSYYHCAY